MSTEKPKTLKFKIKEFWQKHESKIVLTIGMIIVAILVFEAGILKSQNWQQKPLIIEKPAISQSVCQTAPETPSQTKIQPQKARVPQKQVK